MGQWIPVSERLPTAGGEDDAREENVLAFWSSFPQRYAVMWVAEDGKWYENDEPMQSPTHWMPLPDPPGDAT